MLAAMTPGPYRWRSSADLWSLPRFGLPVAFHRLAVQHLAAKLRVASLDMLDFNDRCRQLSDLEAANDEHGWRWAMWHQMSHARVLQRAVHTARLNGVDSRTELLALRSAAAHLGRPQQRKAERGLQRRLAAQLALSPLCQLPHPEVRMRQKIGRWRLGRWLPEAYAASRILRNLQRLAKLVPTNVATACRRAVWNRWCTGRRFQRSASAGAVCRLGCSVTAHDSIEHYAHCGVLRSVGREHFHRSLKLTLPTFLLCDKLSEDDLCFVALLVSEAYRAHNQYRARDVVPAAARAVDCVVYFMREAAARHPNSLRVLTGATPRAPRRLPSHQEASREDAQRRRAAGRPSAQPATAAAPGREVRQRSGYTRFVARGNLQAWPV